MTKLKATFVIARLSELIAEANTDLDVVFYDTDRDQDMRLALGEDEPIRIEDRGEVTFFVEWDDSEEAEIAREDAEAVPELSTTMQEAVGAIPPQPKPESMEWPSTKSSGDYML